MTSQIQENMSTDLVESNCFYAMYAMTESWETFVRDYHTFVDPEGSLKWFNLIMYNPSHLYNNLTVGYEMCDVYQQVERISGSLSGDWAGLADGVALDVTFMVTDGRPELIDMVADFTCPEVAAALRLAEDIATGGTIDKITTTVGDVKETVKDVNTVKASIDDWDDDEDEDDDDLTPEEIAAKVKKAAAMANTAVDIASGAEEKINNTQDTINDITDKVNKAKNIFDNISSCDINWYKGGQKLGNVMSRLFN